MPAPSGPTPFDAVVGELEAVHARCAGHTLAPHYALADAQRLLHDLILTAGDALLPSPLTDTVDHSSLSSLSLSPSLADSVTLRLGQLRDDESLSGDDSRAIQTLLSLAQWAALSSTHTANHASAVAAIDSVRMIGHKFVRQCRTGTVAANDRDSGSRVRDVSMNFVDNSLTAINNGSLIVSGRPSVPHGWTDSEFQQHCQTLWNTAALDCQAIEDELDEADRTAESERDEKLAKIDAAKKEKRQLEKELRERKKAADAKAASREDDEDENENEEESKENDGDSLPDPAAIVIDTAPPPVKKHQPLSFGCVVCHSTLMKASDIHRVSANFVLSKRGVKLDAAIKIAGDSWTQTPSYNDRGRALDQSEDDNEEADDDTVKTSSMSVQSMAVHCNKCLNYMGRYFPSLDRYRLVYIHHATGQNWMFFTGDVDKLDRYLAPLITQSNSDNDENIDDAVNEDEDEVDEPKIKPAVDKPITPIVGLPLSYESIAQAKQYPYPRYPLLAIIAGKASSSANVKGDYQPLTESDVTAIQAQLPVNDALYTFASSSSLSDTYQLLLQCDSEFLHRSLSLLLTSRIRNLFVNFVSSPYGSEAHCPVKSFTHFYLTPPEMTHSRGTARYLFHYLTNRDDSTMKRFPYTLKKVTEARQRNECCIIFLMSGSWSGMRTIVVKIGKVYQIYQSNHNLRHAADRYTVVDWLSRPLSNASDYSRILSDDEFSEFLYQFEFARRGDKCRWERLFCRGQPVANIYTEPKDRFRDTDCQVTIAKLDINLIKP